MERNMESDIACEALAVEYDSPGRTTIDCSFRGQDFGYPCTLEELNAALDKADAERNDPTKWISAVEFHNRLEQKYPWLR